MFPSDILFSGCLGFNIVVISLVQIIYVANILEGLFLFSVRVDYSVNNVMLT